MKFSQKIETFGNFKIKNHENKKIHVCDYIIIEYSVAFFAFYKNQLQYKDNKLYDFKYRSFGTK